MMRRLGLMVLLGCKPEAQPINPVLTETRTALDAWTSAESHLAAGRGEQALRDLDEALQTFPGEPVLLVWRAKSLASLGRHTEAVAVLDAASSRRGAPAVTAYLRAVSRVALGQLDEAALDLARAIEAQALTPREAVADPVFAEARLHPAFAFLPSAALDVALTVPDRVAFLGSHVDVTLRVETGREGLVTLQGGTVTGPVALQRVEEDDVVTETGDRARLVVWTFRVLGRGTVRAPAWQVVVDGVPVEIGPVEFETAAPSDHGGAEDVRTALTLPSALVDGREVPSAWETTEGIWVASGPGERPEIVPPSRPEVLALLSKDGQARIQLSLYGAATQRVRQGAGGSDLWVREADPARRP